MTQPFLARKLRAFAVFALLALGACSVDRNASDPIPSEFEDLPYAPLLPTAAYGLDAASPPNNPAQNERFAAQLNDQATLANRAASLRARAASLGSGIDEETRARLDSATRATP